MGKALAELAPQRGHTVAATIDNDDEWAEKQGLLKGCDMAIEFSTPATAVKNIDRCLEMGLPVVVGTTGWYDQLETMAKECKRREGALFVASNFSIGMNIVFETSRRLARMMNRHKEYDVCVEETHHVHKLDAPSGTAITLASDIVAQRDDKAGWQLLDETYVDPQTNERATKHHEERQPDKVGVVSVRRGEVAGTHAIRYEGPTDSITLTHEAYGRQGLAMGAMLAAEFLEGKKGYYTMQDLLAFDK